MLYYQVHYCHGAELSIFATSAGLTCSRAFNNLFQDGSPFCRTLSFHCNQAVSIALLQDLIFPFCSCEISLSVACRRPSSSPSCFHSTKCSSALRTLTRSASFSNVSGAGEVVGWMREHWCLQNLCIIEKRR